CSMSMKLGVAACFGRMQLTMQNAEHLNQEQIQEFLESSAEIEFAGRGRAEIYAWTERVVVAQEFARLSRKERGLIRAYIGKMTGLSPAQITRLIRTYLDSGSVQERLYHRHQFARHYTDADIALLAEVDRAHERLNGAATRRILEREYLEFGKQEFRRMAGISVSHLYNLRQSARYRKRAAVFEATQAGPARTAGVPARRYGASGGLGWGQGRVPHQCRRHGDSVANRGLHQQDQRAISAPGAGGHTASIPLPNHRVSCRQRLGIHQSQGGGVVKQAGDRIHQEPRLPKSGQCFGGGQKRSRGAQTHRLRLHRRRARR